MGKSSKKGKNERINALRKQYDAFLEEDKKRRDRNEYILGKLDKMRSSTALVPISQKINIPLLLDTHSYNYARSGHPRSHTSIRYGQTSHYEPQNVPSDLVSKCMDESTFLKEISKKYILIPKIRTPTQTTEPICLEPSDDTDWKSKYKILNDIKNQEKEEQSSKIFLSADKDIDSSVDEKEPKKADKKDKINDYTSENINKILQGEPEITRDYTTDEVKSSEINYYNNEDNNVLINRYDEAKIKVNDDVKEVGQMYQENVADKEKSNLNSIEKYTHNPNENCMEQNENYSNQEEYKENTQHVNYNSILPGETVEVPRYENVVESFENPAIKEQVISSVLPQEIEESVENKMESHENAEGLKDDSTYNDHLQAHNVVPHPESHIDDQIVHDAEQHYHSTQDKIPVELENTEHLENVSEINAFEAEQKEMFYSEKTDNSYVHNQEDGDNPKHPAEGYDQTGQYSYYEGVQQEQAYATNINEHEESTERYDPNYTQQYETTYDNQQTDNVVNYENLQQGPVNNYENVNEYEQQQYHDDNYENQIENPVSYENPTESTVNYENQQFENVVNYDNQVENPNLYQQDNVINENVLEENVLMPQESDTQIYDQHVYTDQSDTQQHIEQQLTTEEGYIATLENPSDLEPTKNIEDNEPEKVVDVTSPVEQIPEPKLT